MTAPDPQPSADPKLDAFELFNFQPSMSIDANELESRYLTLSLKHHPDHHAADSESQAEAIARSAEINSAYQKLRDPWIRAETVLEALKPGVLERTKTLPADFLMEAMELAEDVGSADSESKVAELRGRLDGQIREYEQRVRDGLDSGRFEHSAILIHESSYYRKALRDLDASDR